MTYRIYYTDPESGQAKAKDVSSLQSAIADCEYYRNHGFGYVTMVSDYADMVGKPGAKGAGTEYVPQLKN
jgi:hypothetical protein